MSELGANEGESRLHEAFVVPGTTIRSHISPLLAAPVAAKWHLGRDDLQKILDKMQISDVPLAEVPDRLDNFIDAALARAADSVSRSNQGADIDATIEASEKRRITFPAAVTKNGREHVIPYGEHVARLLDTIPNHGNLLFPARGKDTPLNGWSKCKRALDEASAVDHWTLHDLRRTFATNLAALNVPPHVTERLLNHASGTISGVAAIYNRHAYMDEMRGALAEWESFLGKTLATAPVVTVPLAA